MSIKPLFADPNLLHLERIFSYLHTPVGNRWWKVGWSRGACPASQ